MLYLLRPPATGRTRRRAARGTVSNREHTHVRHTMDTSNTPGRKGGLSIRRAASLALPAFLASAAATSDLQCSMLSRCQLSVDKEVYTARSL